MRTRGHHLAESRSCQTRRARRSHARKTARRTCCWFAPGWRYSVRSCKIWSMPACCGCHMGGGGGAAMVSPRPRPSRVSFDRSSRDGDGQTIGSRLVNGGTVRRRAPLAVTPGRLNRSPIRVSKTRRLARGTRQWRLGAGDGSGAQTATNVRRETPFLGTPRKKFRSARPRARPLMSDRARASSPVARRAHDAASAALTLCISAYVLWVLAVRLPLVRRGRPQASRDPEARFPFSRAAATSRRHARADRVRAPTRCPFANRAHLQSLTNALLSATLSRSFPTRALPRNRVATPDTAMDDAS